MVKGKKRLVTKEIAETIHSRYRALRNDGYKPEEAIEAVRSSVKEETGISLSPSTVKCYSLRTFEGVKKSNEGYQQSAKGRKAQRRADRKWKAKMKEMRVKIELESSACGGIVISKVDGDYSLELRHSISMKRRVTPAILGSYGLPVPTNETHEITPESGEIEDFSGTLRRITEDFLKDSKKIKTCY